VVPRPVNPPDNGISLTITPRLWEDLTAHHFPGDRDEHGSVILAEQVTGPRGTRLLARQLIVADDGIDYVPGEHGYRALTATFARDNILTARANNHAYLAVHNHQGDDRVGFSHDDMASHQRGYPALSQISGSTVGGLASPPTPQPVTSGSPTAPVRLSPNSSSPATTYDASAPDPHPHRSTSTTPTTAKLASSATRARTPSP